MFSNSMAEQGRQLLLKDAPYVVLLRSLHYVAIAVELRRAQVGDLHGEARVRDGAHRQALAAGARHCGADLILADGLPKLQAKRDGREPLAERLLYRIPLRGLYLVPLVIQHRRSERWQLHHEGAAVLLLDGGALPPLRRKYVAQLVGLNVLLEC